MSKWTEKYSYWTGVQVNPKLGFFLLGHDEMSKARVPHSILSKWTPDEWKGVKIDWTAIGALWVTQPQEELVIVGRDGQVRAGPLANLQDEEPFDLEPEDGKMGALRCARLIDGKVYVAGMDRQVYRREGKDSWTSLDQNLPAGEEDQVVGFEAIDGFNQNEIYAVGHEGEIWRFDGKAWRKILSPVKQILLGVHCSDDGFVYISGQSGVLLKGRHDTWESLSQEITKQDIWDVVKFKDCLYFATEKIMFQIKEKKASAVEYGQEGTPFTFYRFSISQSEMWVIGPKDVMRFDGQTWSRID